MLVEKKGTIGSSMIRADWLVANSDFVSYEMGVPYEAIIFQKAYWWDMFKYYKGIKILDLCDPDWINGNLDLKKASTMVDAITTSTENLKKFVENVVDIPVVYIPDRLNMKIFHFDKKHNQEAKEVCWFGYMHNGKEVLPMTLPLLSDLNLKLRIISDSDFYTQLNYGVEIINERWSDMAFYSIKSSDFSINPVLDVGRFKYKSNNKSLISWGLGLPVANNEDDMRRFIDPLERVKEINDKQMLVKDKYDIKQSVEQYKDLIKWIKNKKERK